MYVYPTPTYYVGSQQRARRGPFLLLVQSDSSREVRALVRDVALAQCGHWMMGSCRAFGHRLLISGAYGSDGLPLTVPDAVWQRAVPLPSELYQAWNTGGGHNSAGREAPLLRSWAVRNLPLLRPRRARQRAR